MAHPVAPYKKTPAVARGDQVDIVNTNHGCQSTTTTDECSDDVFVNGIGIHRQGDNNTIHLVSYGICVPHQTPITIGSITVFANSMGVARVGDYYTGGENVSCNDTDDDNNQDNNSNNSNGSHDVFAGPINSCYSL